MEPEQGYYERKEQENTEVIECYRYLVIAAALVTALMIVGSWVLTIAGKMF